ncbi:cytochrome c family protein [Pelagibius sp. Alg239-R121]|uniref:c-type cytochrome n=1 Tax=Pelagibius sp. Alg239-R121 TaxID=2993448 RepID=UPI0024A6DB27|nr:cytochrome c family protein [Pelagibius sp. Alg239-R121]
MAIVLPAQAEDTVVSGDALRGESIYGRCKACHSLKRDRTGPRHCGLFGRKAGSVKGFRYSKAMINSGIIWSEDSLDAFLTDTRAFLPKNRMGYAGIKDAQERADLIAYLAQQNRDPSVCN